MSAVQDIPKEKLDSLGIDFVQTLSSYQPSADFIKEIPISFARRYGILGLEDENGHLIVVVSDLANREQLQIVSRALNRPAKPLLAPQSVITHAINDAYQQRSGQAQAMIDNLDRNQVLDEVQRLASREDLLDVASRAPVIKLVNLILLEAAKATASDVHIQPYEDRLIVRMRIDGILSDSFSLPAGIQDEVVSRVKIMAKMNIAEKRLPQDGRATVQIGERLVDLRIASLPTNFGERIVIRLLDKGNRLLELGDLGMESQTLRLFRQLINIEHGLILVTGPTGSGKSTTLYAALKQLNSKEHNILTIEDPIEYHLEGISQTQVSDRKGMTFASGLRSVLRQDPDVIMVGEIRDRETATMAIQSSLTGHLVFSTLHTNDAASAIARLLDLGIEPYLVASSLVGVLAQRLVRRVCRDCGNAYHPNTAELQWLGVSEESTSQMKQGTGCPTCRQTGYRGRLGTFELLLIDDAIRQLIQQHATAAQIKEAAKSAGLQTLRDDGIRKILAGITTISEVERVTVEPEM
ncbi:MAG TPA: type II secretion system ATPase GspE [Tepidisphaeraceae bacterium]|nr:type II secretion system ATPase GspE [Tepidisphaeraceae bacterium]